MSTEYVAFFTKAKSCFDIKKPNERKLIKEKNKALSSMDFLDSEEEKLKTLEVGYYRINTNVFIISCREDDS